MSKQMSPTVFEQAAETGRTTFPLCWQTIQQMAAMGATHEKIEAELRKALGRRRMSAKFWRWVEDATTAAKCQSETEAWQRRRQFRLVK